MKITIVGGGNIGTQFAVRSAAKGHDVTIFTSKPEQFQNELSIADGDGTIVLKGKIQTATNKAEVAFKDCDVIFITMPAYCMQDLAEQILPYVRPDLKIGIIPGTGGGECAFKNCVEQGAVVFGLQRVPAIARLVTYGAQVCSTGYRQLLHVAAIPKKETDICCKLITEIFDMPCQGLPDYLNLTLTPSNPILHTTRLCALFQDYQEGVVYQELPLFYEEWDNASSELLFACDAEVQQLCMTMKEFDLSYVVSLKKHYESETPDALTKKISSIQSFKGIKTPAVAVEGGFIPDLDSRYFTADFPYGLSIIKQIATLANVNTPYIDRTLDWYHGIAGEQTGFQYKRYGINNYEEFVEFYNR
jgi:hypothetical protein